MEPIDRQFTAETARTALVIIAVVVAGAAFYWLNTILTPLALALFLLVMIDGFARVLSQRAPALPKAAALPVAIVTALILFCLIVYVLADNIRGFAGQLLAYAPKLDGVIARLAAAMGVAVPPTLGQIVQSLSPAAFVGRLADGVRGFVTDSVLVLIYLGFLLASRRGFEHKMGGLFLNAAEREHADALFLRIRRRIEQYLWIRSSPAGSSPSASWGVMAPDRASTTPCSGPSPSSSSASSRSSAAPSASWPRPCSPWCSSTAGGGRLVMLAGLQVINFSSATSSIRACRAAA